MTDHSRSLDLPATRRRETILLVDDEKEVRAVLRALLQRQGYTVLDAATGTEAMRIAASHPGQIDLVVTDLVMPKMSGHQLAERLTEMRPALRVLFISGYLEDTAGCGDVGVASGFVQKPFGMSEFATTVRELLDRGGRAAIAVPALRRAL